MFNVIFLFLGSFRTGAAALVGSNGTGVTAVLRPRNVSGRQHDMETAVVLPTAEQQQY